MQPDTSTDIVALYSLLAVYGSAALLIVIERLKPATGRANRPGWYLRALSINACNLLVFYLLDGMFGNWFADHALISAASNWQAWFGAAAAYLVFTFIVYWWHRARHTVPLLWRWCHQLHHSPARIETLTAYYIHPLDMCVNLLISSAIVFGMFGLDFAGAAWYTVITGCAGFLIHANINLPRCVGYVFQTPNMHRLHHQRQVHAFNYSDIVWWDMLFGTYANPEELVDDCGFDQPLESKLLPMLLGRDQHQRT